MVGAGWSAFAYARDGVAFIGTIQRGMQIGALARMADGTYAQINGDIIETLNKSRVEFALRAATGTRAGQPIVNIPRVAPATLVTVKKRRRVVLPSGAGD